MANTPERRSPETPRSTGLDYSSFDNKTNPSDPRYVQLMNANDSPGPSGPDYLSSIEIGILKDLGYIMT